MIANFVWLFISKRQMLLGFEHRKFKAEALLQE
jgi:hypothetical protein